MVGAAGAVAANVAGVGGISAAAATAMTAAAAAAAAITRRDGIDFVVGYAGWASGAVVFCYSSTKRHWQSWASTRIVD
jgi:hypothetical protein